MSAGWPSISRGMFAPRHRSRHPRPDRRKEEISNPHARRRTVAIAIDIERNAVERAYDRWAPVYDLVFGPVFERGRRAAIVAAERVGGGALHGRGGAGAPASGVAARQHHL